MTPRGLAVLRCCADPLSGFENLAVIQDRAFMVAGIQLNHTRDTLSILADDGLVDRLRKGPGKFQYRRSANGQAAVEKAVTV